jgi:Asp-tRNA(Asn)/Glu-tRNA(Gln) amidotransferase A subunit family amidase
MPSAHRGQDGSQPRGLSGSDCHASFDAEGLDHSQLDRAVRFHANLGDRVRATTCEGRRQGQPLAVQLVAPDGGEPLLLGVAAMIERLAPWPRVAPGSWG